MAPRSPSPAPPSEAKAPAPAPAPVAAPTAKPQGKQGKPKQAAGNARSGRAAPKGGPGGMDAPAGEKGAGSPKKEGAKKKGDAKKKGADAKKKGADAKKKGGEDEKGEKKGAGEEGGEGVQIKMPPPPTEPSKAAKERLATAQGKVKTGAQTTKTLPDADKHTNQARDAVVEPEKEIQAKADQKKVKQVDDRPPPHPKIIKLVKKIRKIIRDKRPPDEDELVKAKPEKMAKEAGKEVQGDVKGDAERVSGDYDDLQKKQTGKEERKPKEYQNPDAKVETPNPKVKTVVPDKVPREKANLDADVADAEKRAEDAGLNKETAKLVEDGPIAKERAARGELNEAAKEDPAAIQKKQKKAIADAQAKMTAMHENSAKIMADTRGQTVAANAKQQLAMVQTEEQARKVIGTAADTIIKDTRTKVNTLLAPLAKNAQDKWKTNIAVASKDFKDTLKKVDKWIKKRHSGVGGFFLSIGDALTGLPDWVTDTYDRAEKKFGDAATDLAIDISRDIEKAIKDANTLITNARKQIDGMFDALPGHLQKWAEKEKGVFSGRLDKIQQTVDKKRDEITENLATQLGETVQEVREEIHKRREAAKGLLSKIADFINEFLDDPVKAIINGLLSILGIPKATFWRLVDRLSTVMEDISDDPKKFGNNLMKALSKGFNQFFDNIKTHLLTGLLRWLFGKLDSVGVTAPADFSMGSIITLFLQIMGITWANIRKLLVKHAGERNVALVEKAVDMIKLLMDKGISGVWELIKEKLNPKAIFDTVMKAAVEYLVETLIKKVTIRILAMLNPVGAILQAIEAIYKVIKWLLENARKIFALFETIVNGAMDILKGNIGGMANSIEKVLVGLIAPVIDFLASLLGLDGLPGHVAKVIGGLQAKVMGILDQVIGGIVKRAKAFLAKLGIGKKGDPKKPPGAKGDGVGKLVRFDGHKLWIAMVGGKPVPMVRSDEAKVEARLQAWHGKLDTLDETKKKEAKTRLSRAMKQLGVTVKEAKEEVADEKVSTAAGSTKQQQQKADKSEAETAAAEDMLAKDLQWLFKTFGETSLDGSETLWKFTDKKGIKRQLRLKSDKKSIVVSTERGTGVQQQITEYRATLTPGPSTDAKNKHLDAAWALHDQLTKAVRARDKAPANEKAKAKEKDTAILKQMSEKLVAAGMWSPVELKKTHVNFLPRVDELGTRGGKVVADPLTRVPGNTTGSAASDVIKNWSTQVGDNKGGQWKRVHMLSDNLHGPGDNPANLVPGDATVNGSLKNGPEAAAFKAIREDKTLRYVARVTGWQKDDAKYFPSGISVSVDEKVEGKKVPLFPAQTFPVPDRGEVGDPPEVKLQRAFDERFDAGDEIGKTSLGKAAGVDNAKANTFLAPLRKNGAVVKGDKSKKQDGRKWYKA